MCSCISELFRFLPRKRVKTSRTLPTRSYCFRCMWQKKHFMTAVKLKAPLGHISSCPVRVYTYFVYFIFPQLRHLAKPFKAITLTFFLVNFEVIEYSWTFRADHFSRAFQWQTPSCKRRQEICMSCHGKTVNVLFTGEKPPQKVNSGRMASAAVKRAKVSEISISTICEQWCFHKREADRQMNSITNDLSENNMVDACCCLI